VHDDADPRPDGGADRGRDGDRDVVVVSNREPYVHHSEATEGGVEQPVGGLTAALDSVMCDLGGTWIAWGSGDADFRVADADGRVEVPPDEPRYTLRRVPLSSADQRKYYYGYANQTLWPLCHEAIPYVHVRPGFWERYRAVNERFAAAAAAAAPQDALVWLQDYHLALAAREVRERRPDLAVQQFWHVPWPPATVFDRLPHARTLLAGLCGNDRLGFHTDTYVERFLDTVERHLPDADVDRAARTVSFDGPTTVYAAPVGIDPEEVGRTAARDAGDRFWADFRARHDVGEEETVALAVDRLDYSKGVVERVEAVEALLVDRPDLHGRFRLVQKGSPSRSEIPDYHRYHQRVLREVERVNERFEAGDWRPIVHVEENYAREALVALYANADLCVVTPVADGYNLVAQEYVAARDGPGALVLSEFAGVHDLLGEAALSVNPHDRGALAGAIERAVDGLAADSADLGSRFDRLRAAIDERTVGDWVAAGLDTDGPDR
jgi:trehalose 6-phosphate synthase